MKRFMRLTVPALSMLLFFMSTSFACEWGDAHRPDTYASELNLTTDQKDKLQTIRHQNQVLLQSKYETNHNLSRQIDQLLQVRPIDQTKINNLLKQQTDLFADLRKTEITAREAILGVLSDKQLVQFKKLVQKWEKQWAEKHRMQR